MHKVECSGPIFSKEQTNFNQIFTAGNPRLLWYKSFKLLVDERFCVLDVLLVVKFFFPLQRQDN